MRIACLLSILLASGSSAQAQEDHAVPPAGSTAEDVDSGDFLPQAMSAHRNPQRSVGSVVVVWDDASSRAVLDGTAEAPLVRDISFRAGAHLESEGHEVGPRFELRWDALSQRGSGIDLALASGYDGAGFNTVPAVDLKLAVGRDVGAAYLLANVVYGQGLDLGERYGAAHVAALRRVSTAISVGFDSGVQVDLERDADEPAGEKDFEWRNVLVASASVSNYVVSLGGGLGAFRLRAEDLAHWGPVALLGIGTSF